jgi:glycosyltransferase involved in cell wall biosynthesis
MTAPEKPLRILAIVNLPWDSRLGASRVWMELADQWRADGHTVEKYSLSDAFPGVRGVRATFALRQLFFLRKAAAFVRKHGDRFDVIDALIGTLPHSREELGFNGVIVARSVGLYLLYDRFERTQQARTPKGKFVGRLLYGFARRRLLRASAGAVRRADLINVPNEAEAECLRTEIGSGVRVIVEPYGLTSERRHALAGAAAMPEIRLAQQRICFLGMWSPRKGAQDWAKIIAHVRSALPATQFRFLGTMVEAAAVRRDLGGVASEGIEFVSAFEPDELPGLLADCTVAAFPSYVEGFGLAVIEQLAAGLPVVAYDTPGPRDILASISPELLVPSGDAEKFADALLRLLRLHVDAYRRLADESATRASAFSWPQIARHTISAYRQILELGRRPIVFVQPFGIGSPGGGSRILRALLEEAPLAWRSLCSSPRKPKPWPNETHLPSRPYWGRIEHSRFAAWPALFHRFFERGFRRRLEKACRQLGACAIHAVPHGGLDFAAAQAVARRLSLPFFISLHDDLAYTALGVVPPRSLEAAMNRAWQEATACFVISDALGQEYCRRYGKREFGVVTDGISELSGRRPPADPDRLRIYFMGLFHMGYERNLRALLEAITLLERDRPGLRVTVTLRCEHVRAQVLAGVKEVTILPFADEAQVRRDLEQADMLYLPLPFGEEHQSFARYSLSTKMVTYVGSGLPILYHGPTTSAAFELLQKHQAAIPVTSLAPEEIAARLRALEVEERNAAAANALALARDEFMLADQRAKFWNGLAEGAFVS